MDKTISDNLCHGLRACGIPKEMAHQIQNEITKWYDCNGPEWTNQRIKDLRQWYETTLAGEPTPPDWFRHSKSQTPIGIWGKVFKLDPSKALGILSANTVFINNEFTETQKKKFLKGLEGTNSQQEDVVAYAGALLSSKMKFDKSYLFEDSPLFKVQGEPKYKTMPPIMSPTLFDMTGSVPVHEGHTSVRPEENLGLAAKALAESWESLPEVTAKFLEENSTVLGDMLSYFPESKILDVANGMFKVPKTTANVGRVSVLQQPELKARVVGNPNRVLQVTLNPLKEVFMTYVHQLRTDVTFAQEIGVSWVQDQLRHGVKLAGSDLTSASDLLDIDLCLQLVDSTFNFSSIEGYREYERYYKEVCKASWWCPSLKDAQHPKGQQVSWKQGSVLGTGPSFGLLTLTNNCCGLYAFYRWEEESAKQGKVVYTMPNNTFRVVGDDIVMRAELAPYYNEIITALGGEVNLSKTLTSDKVAEFAGRVITPERKLLKRVKYSEPSDMNFMSYMAQLGDQAKHFLKPRQRKVYDFYRPVPGIAVDGPWVDDSYGESLLDRYLWYLTEVQPALSREEPDAIEEEYQMSLLRAQLDARQQSLNIDEGLLVPINEEGYLPSTTTTAFKTGGDPRLANGKTTLEVLEEPIKKKAIQPYKVWKQSRYEQLRTLVHADAEEVNNSSQNLDRDITD